MFFFAYRVMCVLSFARTALDCEVEALLGLYWSLCDSIIFLSVTALDCWEFNITPNRADD